MDEPRPGFLKTFGLTPVRPRLAQAWLALRGDANVPPTRWGVSSLRIFKPEISWPTWLGRRRRDRTVPIYNLFNRTRTPVTEGWSVRTTQVEDYRGGRLTYDSHDGTDFAIPVGTPVVAAAGGRVIRVSNEFHRGGLKVLVDHGSGVVTGSSHLAQSFVEVGARVRRGEPIGLSGASGLDLALFFPWVAPHVHFSVFLDGVTVDPFARQGSGEVSLWRDGNDPRPPGAASPREPAFEPAAFDGEALEHLVQTCIDEGLRARLQGIDDRDALGAELLFETSYFPTRFSPPRDRSPRRAPLSDQPRLYERAHPRVPILSLPFRAEDVTGVWYPDAPR